MELSEIKNEIDRQIRDEVEKYISDLTKQSLKGYESDMVTKIYYPSKSEFQSDMAKALNQLRTLVDLLLTHNFKESPLHIGFDEKFNIRKVRHKEMSVITFNKFPSGFKSVILAHVKLIEIQLGMRRKIQDMT
jgi:hypothetical protein